MSRMYHDGVLILDVEYVVAAHLVCRGGQWMIDLLLGLGSEGTDLTAVYPSMSEAERAFLAIGQLLGEETP